VENRDKVKSIRGIEMELLEGKVSYKRKICSSVGLFLHKLYSLTRECSGIKKTTEAKMEEIKKNEEEIEIVYEELPKIKSEIDLMMEKNENLNRSINMCVDDLEFIYEKLLVRDVGAAIELLEQYPFAKDKKLN